MKRGRPMANSRHCREKVHFRKLLGTGTDCATSTLIASGVEEVQRSKINGSILLLLWKIPSDLSWCKGGSLKSSVCVYYCHILARTQASGEVQTVGYAISPSPPFNPLFCFVQPSLRDLFPFPPILLHLSFAVHMFGWNGSWESIWSLKLEAELVKRLALLSQ